MSGIVAQDKEAKMKRLDVVGAAIVVLGLGGSPAAAQSVTSTYVASTGANKGGCTRAAPCLTFAYAIGQTPAGGEIVALDVAGYGPVNITKAITISSQGPGRAYIGNNFNAGGAGAGVNINAGAGDVVRLRGLQIVSGAFGISVNQVGSLDIDNVAISDTTSMGLMNNAAGNVFVRNSTFTNNAGYGIFTGTGSGALTVKNVSITGSKLEGIRSNGSSLIVANSTINYSVGNGINVAGSGVAFIKSTTLNYNGGAGLIAGPSSGAVNIDTVTATGNGNGGVTSGSSQGRSYGNNNIVGNTGGDLSGFTQVPLD